MSIKESVGGLVQLETLDSLLQVELVEVVEGHEVSVPPEDVHLVSEDGEALPVAGARFLPDDEAVALVVEYLLRQLLVIALLTPDRL